MAEITMDQILKNAAKATERQLDEIVNYFESDDGRIYGFDLAGNLVLVATRELGQTE